MSVKPKQPQPPDNPTPPRLLDLIIPLLGTMGVMLPVAPAFAPGVNDNSGIYLYAGWR